MSESSAIEAWHYGFNLDLMPSIREVFSTGNKIERRGEEQQKKRRVNVHGRLMDG
jgi:hypothetical protein